MPAKQRKSVAGQRPVWAVLNLHHDGQFVPAEGLVPDDWPDVLVDEWLEAGTVTTTKPKGGE